MTQSEFVTTALYNVGTSKSPRIHHWSYDSYLKSHQSVPCAFLHKQVSDCESRVQTLVCWKLLTQWTFWFLCQTCDYIRGPWALVPDLWSLSKQLLLLQSQPLFVNLLQSHLTVAPHDSTVRIGGQWASLFHWGTLGDPLLVQRCRKRQTVNMDTSQVLKMSQGLLFNHIWQLVNSTLILRFCLGLILNLLKWFCTASFLPNED